MTALEAETLFSKSIEENKNQLEQRGIKHLDSLFAASDYKSSPLLRLAIRRWKYGNIRGIEERFFSLLIKRFPPIPDGAVLCPVPLHWTRLFERGFNQAEILSKLLASEWGISTLQFLKRTRPTGHQAWRKKVDRIFSMKQAFKVVRPPSRYIILIDDLSTTGATLDACAQALRNAGAERVDGWVIAHSKHV